MTHNAKPKGGKMKWITERTDTEKNTTMYISVYDLKKIAQLDLKLLGCKYFKKYNRWILDENTFFKIKPILYNYMSLLISKNKIKR